MMLTDLNGPLALQPRRTGLGRISFPSPLSASIALFLCCATFGAAVSRAQDQQTQSVAEAARQERARKEEVRKRAAHVYTDDDLKRAHILTPADRAIAEAKRLECAQKNNCTPAAPQNPPASLDANSGTHGISLGEVARKYRAQKELQALKPKQTAPFHLPYSTPALASPILPERPAIRPAIQPALRPKMPSNVFRRDPFSAMPRREHLPAGAQTETRSGVRGSVRDGIRAGVGSNLRENSRERENVRPALRPNVHAVVRQDVLPHIRPNIFVGVTKAVRPNLRPRARVIAPAKPRISSRLAPPSLLLRSAQPIFLAKPAQPVAPAVDVLPVQPRHSLPALPISSAQKTLLVQPGDSLWKLAHRNLGHGNRWLQLLAANPWIANPNRLRIGEKLYLPPAVATPPAVPKTNGDAARYASGYARTTTGTASRSAVPDRASPVIKVQKGDNLWNLARTILGHSSNWRCLAAANPAIHDPNRIYTGQMLRLPSTCGP
ncbi:MAG: LysM peptidoglycan-binding domain-containing protein [Candidatus Acidiferrum sp.]